MTPGTLSKGKTYLYNDDLRLTYSHETINYYMFTATDYPTDGYWHLTFTQVKNQLTDPTKMITLISWFTRSTGN